VPGTGTLTLAGTIVGYPTGQRVVNLLWPLPASIDESLQLFLNVGDNPVVVPGGASIVVIEFPSSNAAQVILKGTPGDTGIALHRTLPHVQSLDVTVGGFVLTAMAPLTGPVQLTFF
jgi:hypothetical protein